MKSFLMWPILVTSMVGFLFGMGGYTFVQGEGLSYFSDDPKACMNCHVMQDHYYSWSKSPHREVTTCNTCHLPENSFSQAFYKAENALNHSVKFTTGFYKEPIRIREHNFDIALKACLNCHGNLFDDSTHRKGLQEGNSCLHCHDNVGHPH